jgi:Mor family transcriptional regulator
MVRSLVNRQEASLEWLCEEIADVVRPEFGGSVERSQSLAQAVLKRLRERCGGRNIYIASAAKLRQEAIVAEFNGRNIPDLAQKHGVSERWVRRLTSKPKEPLEK